MNIKEKRKPVHIILNPLSGQGGSKFILNRLLKLMSRAHIDVECHSTRKPGHATRLAQSIAPRASAVIPWGGDGTVNEVTQGLLGTDTPLLCVHGGTENLLAKELCMPRRPENIFATLLSEKTMQFDVGWINGKTFLSIVGIGFDAEVVRRVSAARTGHISHLNYFWPIWRTFWEFDFPRLSVTADGEHVFSGDGLVFVGNIKRYSSGLRICSRASCSDGVLDLVVFKCASQGRLVLHSLFTLFNRHHIQPDVIYKTAKNIQIKTEKPLTCEIDGDVGPVSPLNISVAPQKIRLFLPVDLSPFSRFTDRFFPCRFYFTRGNAHNA